MGWRVAPPPPLSNPPTWIETAKARYVYGGMTFEAFEREVDELLLSGHADRPLPSVAVRLAMKPATPTYRLT